MSDIITYEMLLDDSLTDGVYAVSLVTKPAIEMDYVLLSKDGKDRIEIVLDKLADKKRKVVCGAVLVPDKVIPRDGFNIVFSADTIRKISENFLIDGNKDNVTIQHKLSVNKVKLIESWIVEDPELDKSKALGFVDVKAGTWFASYKIEDDNLWTEYLETGILKGFSIEGEFSKKEVHLHSENCSCHYHLEDMNFDFADYNFDIDDKDIYDMIMLIKEGEKRGGGSGVDDVPNYKLEDLDKLYIWKVKSPEGLDCPICARNKDKVFSLRQWAIIGIPRVRKGTSLGKGTNLTTQYRGKADPYATYCETDCKCELVEIKQPQKPKNPYVDNTGNKVIPKPKSFKLNPDYVPTLPIGTLLPNGKFNVPWIVV